MRSREDIQRAHDAILPILLGEVPMHLDDEDRRHWHACADVLCWVLGHSHNQSFEDNLRRLEQELLAQGFKLPIAPERR